MNITFKKTQKRYAGRRGLSAALRKFAGLPVLLFASCLQGPWDYYPEKMEAFRGLFVYGYVIADKPVTGLCVEKMLRLDEEYTNAFVFYKSADLELTGEFSGSEKTIALSPDAQKVNCFNGPLDELPARGNEYQLSGTVDWDSAGRQVTTNFSATAVVPKSFAINDTAKAPYFAVNPFTQLDSNSNPIEEFTALINALPEDVGRQLFEAHGDSILQLWDNGDTVGVMNYILENQSEIEAIINQAELTYVNGDPLWYLTGSLNTLSHYFTADRSEDVGAVLVTNYYDPEKSSQPRTAFTGFFGIEPDTGDYFSPGTGNRLIIYPDAVGPNGWNLLENIGVVNTWFIEGTNHLRFYGMQKEYYDYTERSIQEESNSKVDPFYNIQGAAGIFVGGIADSFVVNIKVAENWESYSFDYTRPFYCEEEGWFDSKFCREFYPKHCREVSYEKYYCARAYIMDTIPNEIDTSFLKDSLKLSSAGIDNAIELGKIGYCIQNEFGDVKECETALQNCREDGGINKCKEELWTYCLDNKWLAENGKSTGICSWAMVSYCSDKPRQSEILCGQADIYCEENPDETLCR